MNCPNCGRELPPLAVLLAQTESGTQCPFCWARLQRLRRPLDVLGKRRPESSEPPLRWAA